MVSVNKLQPRSGIEARDWVGVAEDKWKKEFEKRIEAALVEAAEESGHVI